MTEDSKRLQTALDRAGVGKRGRAEEVARRTLYAAGSIKQVLTGAKPIKPRLAKAVGEAFGINPDFILNGTGPVMARPAGVDLAPYREGRLCMVRVSTVLLSDLVPFPVPAGALIVGVHDDFRFAPGLGNVLVFAHADLPVSPRGQLLPERTIQVDQDGKATFAECGGL